jgi:hypothetical protein
MASGGDNANTIRRPAEWDRLELGVRRLLDEHERWRGRALAAEGRVAEVETKLDAIARDGLDPTELMKRIERLEKTNRELLARLDRARGNVHSILTRLELLEDER